MEAMGMSDKQFDSFLRTMLYSVKKARSYEEAIAAVEASCDEEIIAAVEKRIKEEAQGK